MTSRSAQKGNRFELELAAHLNARLGLDARRAVLSGGGVIHGAAGGADLTGTPGLHIEAKRVERLDFPGALRQAEAAIARASAPERPVVVNRRNRQPTGDSYVLLRLDHFLDLYQSWLRQQGYIRDDPTKTAAA